MSKSVVAKKHVSAAKRGAAAWSDSFVFVSPCLLRLEAKVLKSLFCNRQRFQISEITSVQTNKL